MLRFSCLYTWQRNKQLRRRRVLKFWLEQKSALWYYLCSLYIRYWQLFSCRIKIWEKERNSEWRERIVQRFTCWLCKNKLVTNQLVFASYTRVINHVLNHFESSRMVVYAKRFLTCLTDLILKSVSNRFKQSCVNRTIHSLCLNSTPPPQV